VFLFLGNNEHFCNVDSSTSRLTTLKMGSYCYVLILIIVNNSAKYSVVREQCKGNSIFLFHGNNEHFCNVDSYI